MLKGLAFECLEYAKIAVTGAATGAFWGGYKAASIPACFATSYNTHFHKATYF